MAETLSDLIERDRRVLHDIVQKARADALRIHAEIDQDERSLDRVDDVRLPRDAPLPAVRYDGKIISLLHAGNINRTVRAFNIFL